MVSALPAHNAGGMKPGNLMSSKKPNVGDVCGVRVEPLRRAHVGGAKSNGSAV